ncbi:hypothetical protein HMI54_011494 [Coelomomyces lativittatus]|nr:hypothetical protein HMI54_011494 [Coelomomyces lativittatus]
MEYLKVIFQIFIFASFLIRNIHSHAGMTYPPARPILKDGVPDEDSNNYPIFPEDTPLYDSGHWVHKTFPCGTSQPNPEKIHLQKGNILPVEIEVRNWHDGGTCQFSISYDNANTFIAFHQILNDCFVVGNYPEKIKLNVPIPHDLPGGNAVFAWTWITKKSRQPEYYMGCSDVKVDGPTVGKVTGFPLIVASIHSKDPYLRIFSGDSEHSFLFQKNPTLVMSVDGNKIDLNNKLFTPTRHLKKNDPLFEEFKKTISSTTKNENPEVKATSPATTVEKPVEGINKPVEDAKKPGKGIEKPVEVDAQVPGRGIVKPVEVDAKELGKGIEKPVEVDAQVPGRGIEKPVEVDAKEPGKGIEKPPEETIISQETVKNALKSGPNTPQTPHWCHGKFFSKK